MKEQFITVKDFKLNNHCPECFSNSGLVLTYKQKFVENSFYKSLTSETTKEMSCKTCNTSVYPSMWTDDIERVVIYKEKAFSPKKTSFKLKKISWILIGISLGLIVTAIILILTL